MILFFFLLLMLAMAWGVADHFQDMVKQAPPTPPPARIEVPADKAPITTPPVPIAQGDAGQAQPPGEKLENN